VLFFFLSVPLVIFYWGNLLAHCQAAKKYFGISPSQYIGHHLIVYQFAAIIVMGGGG
jgi:hypothetical protein